MKVLLVTTDSLLPILIHPLTTAGLLASRIYILVYLSGFDVPEGCLRKGELALASKMLKAS